MPIRKSVAGILEELAGTCHGKPELEGPSIASGITGTSSVHSQPTPTHYFRIKRGRRE
jgi:hypothetical protein